LNWSTFSGSTVCLDANVFIYAIEGENRFSGLLRDFFTAVEEGVVSIATSEITIGEVLAKPYMLRADALIRDYEDVFASDGVVTLLNVSRPIIERAARVRAETRLKLIDAIHVATAVEHGAAVLLSNDIELTSACPGPLNGMLLSDLIDG
jgi:predicted nucleic acid-binding protein